MSQPGKFLPKPKLIKVAFVVFILLTSVAIAHAQKVESKDRDRGQIMLDIYQG